MAMQYTLPNFEKKQNFSDLKLSEFSHNGDCQQKERIALENRYSEILEQTDEFNRKLVSYQGNKGELVHKWIHYREGFSFQLVEKLIKKFNVKPGDTLLEPFSGSATTLLACKALEINALGIEILPICHLTWQAKSHVFEYDIEELNNILGLLEQIEPTQVSMRFPHIVITQSAFSHKTENDLMFYTQWIETIKINNETKILLRLLLSSVLEDISYTRKDGQYLRWDYRSEKIKKRNEIRVSKGKKPTKKIDKGELPTVKEALVNAFRKIIYDIEFTQRKLSPKGKQEMIKGSVLEILPTLEPNQFNGVITSPPYCNRYDYTRTYALELAYLNIGESEIRKLRQTQLSCTVENRSKLNDLEGYYKSINQSDRFKEISRIILQNRVFQEINEALKKRWDIRDINNKGVLSMVEGYFAELTFVFAEIYRTCKSGSKVAFVNDNVRYGGEIIPVDLLSTELAENIGFVPMRVYVLPQRKGNSSQQMGKFGRVALRKSITVWKKP
ncbi:MAG: site-specific DNA-methyltransferase [Desulfobacteraceae bacterium]|nr:site-specific DNA-methyltransferase [Desulfobacteraceae bacterium]